MKISLNLIFLLASAINCQDVEHFFSSLVHLERLGERESELVTELAAISTELNDNYVKNKLHYFRFENELFREDAVRYIANPLNALSMIKRATVDVSLIIERLTKQQQPVGALARYRISEASLAHAVKCLLLIQRIYKLSTHDLARGIVKNRRVGERMTPNDLFAFGRIASELDGEEFLAREYLLQAWKAHQQNLDFLKEVDPVELLMAITKLSEKMNDYKTAAVHLKELLTMDPENVDAAEYAMKIVQLFQTHGNAKLSLDDPFNVKLERDGQYSRRKEFELVSDVCRGELTSERSKSLRCRYISSSSGAPFVRFQLEEVTRTPPIVLFVDALSDGEIQSLRRKASDEKSTYDGVRVAALHDKDHALAARISRRIEDMTGLAVDAGEPLTVQLYAAGGPVWPPQRHRKMAAMLFYMNDDHMDGYTAFPYLKLRVPPRKGAALFWFTLKHSGAHEYGSRFTQCPVLYRSKWIAYKNLYERGQELRRPCLREKSSERTTRVDDYDDEVF